MTRIRVYKFGLQPPCENKELIEAQLRAAHEYRNDLVRIEKGRRWATRLIDDTPAVAEAIELLKAATKSTRKAALKELSAARKVARESSVEELARIKELDATIRRDARALTPTYWGTYLGIEASSDQARKMPLYESDGVTPSDPRFVRWSGEGQLGVQLQGGLLTPDGLSGRDTRVRISGGRLYLRIGSDARAPIWGVWPIKLHRAIPDAATWVWVRVSRRNEGPRVYWSCEITLAIPGESTRELATELGGAIAVEVEWYRTEDAVGNETLRVGSWRDDKGQTGTVVLPYRIASAIRKPDGIRAVRDISLNELRPKLARLLRDNAEPKPEWLTEASNVLHLWKSPERFYQLVKRWRAEKCDAAREAYDLLQAWELRDHHLWEYESGVRGQSLRARREFYRVLSSQWASLYKTVILDDRDLSREARWGDDSDLRFTASPFEFRQCLRSSFESDVAEHHYTPDKLNSESEDRAWCEQAIDAWIAGGARNSEKERKIEAKGGGAWAARKERKAGKSVDLSTARKVSGKCADLRVS